MNETKETGRDNDLNEELLGKAVGKELSSAIPKIIAAIQLPWARTSSESEPINACEGWCSNDPYVPHCQCEGICTKYGKRLP